jgi:hypothetical protein
VMKLLERVEILEGMWREEHAARLQMEKQVKAMQRALRDVQEIDLVRAKKIKTIQSELVKVCF